MIALPDNYEEIIAEALREMAAYTAGVIAAAMKQQPQDPFPVHGARMRTTGSVGKKTAAPTTPRGSNSGSRNGTNL